VKGVEGRLSGAVGLLAALFNTIRHGDCCSFAAPVTNPPSKSTSSAFTVEVSVQAKEHGKS